MSGGQVNSNQQNTPTVNFNPQANGGSISIGGGFGLGGVNFGGSNSATGPTTGLDLNLNLSGAGGKEEPKKIMLVNLMQQPRLGTYSRESDGTVSYKPSDAKMREIEAQVRKYVPANLVNEEEWAPYHHKNMILLI